MARRPSPTTTRRPASRSPSAATSSACCTRPGHSPGCCCFHDAAAGTVFSGDTLFCGGPGATGRSYSDEPTILRSIRDVLLALPDETVVHTGHGESTTIGAEAGLLWAVVVGPALRRLRRRRLIDPAAQQLPTRQLRGVTEHDSVRWSRRRR